jgi:hypothetical protein
MSVVRESTIFGANTCWHHDVDGEERRVACLDGWIVWEAEERGRSSPSLPPLFSFVLKRGESYPSLVHSAEDLLGFAREGAAMPSVSFGECGLCSS